VGMDEAAQVVRAVYEAVEASDHPTVRDLLADEVSWRQAPSAVPAAGRELTSPDAVVEQVLATFERDWAGFTEQVEHLDALGSAVVTTGTYRGTYRSTGRTLEAEFCHRWIVERGRVRAFRQFTDTAAFAAVVTPRTAEA
jgi:ketosteroid isomerase-like protein